MQAKSNLGRNQTGGFRMASGRELPLVHVAAGHGPCEVLARLALPAFRKLELLFY